MQWHILNKSGQEQLKTIKSPVYVPQVNRFMGNRWEHHDWVWQEHLGWRGIHHFNTWMYQKCHYMRSGTLWKLFVCRWFNPFFTQHPFYFGIRVLTLLQEANKHISEKCQIFFLNWSKYAKKLKAVFVWDTVTVITGFTT